MPGIRLIDVRAALAALGLAGLAALAVAITTHLPVPAPSGPAAHASSAGLSRLQSLPLQAQSVISSTIAADSRAFTARRTASGWGLSGGGVRADFRAGAPMMHTAGGTLSLSLARSRRVTSVTAHGNRVTLRAPAPRVVRRRAAGHRAGLHARAPSCGIGGPSADALARRRRLAARAGGRFRRELRRIARRHRGALRGPDRVRRQPPRAAQRAARQGWARAHRGQRPRRPLPDHDRPAGPAERQAGPQRSHAGQRESGRNQRGPFGRRQHGAGRGNIDNQSHGRRGSSSAPARPGPARTEATPNDGSTPPTARSAPASRSPATATPR